MCDFRHIYFGPEGYVSKCKGCGRIQVAFGGMVLTLTAHDFQVLCHVTDFKCTDLPGPLYDNVKTVIIPTPYPCICYFLTPHEAINLKEMLDKADNEQKTRAMLDLFTIVN